MKLLALSAVLLLLSACKDDGCEIVVVNDVYTRIFAACVNAADDNDRMSQRAVNACDKLSENLSWQKICPKPEEVK